MIASDAIGLRLSVSAVVGCRNWNLITGLQSENTCRSHVQWTVVVDTGQMFLLLVLSGVVVTGLITFSAQRSSPSRFKLCDSSRETSPYGSYDAFDLKQTTNQKRIKLYSAHAKNFQFFMHYFTKENTWPNMKNHMFLVREILGNWLASGIETTADSISGRRNRISVSKVSDYSKNLNFKHFVADWNMTLWGSGKSFCLENQLSDFVSAG